MMAGVWILNSQQQRLHQVRLQRAVSLVLDGKAVLWQANHSRPLRDTRGNCVMPWPEAVLLLRYVPARPRLPWSAEGVFQRDRFRCQYCGRSLARDEATIDHVLPRCTCERLGLPANIWTNTVTACRPCQDRKADKTMAQARMRFKFGAPVEPSAPAVEFDPRLYDWTRPLRASTDSRVLAGRRARE
jgi:hypothetical protein